MQTQLTHRTINPTTAATTIIAVKINFFVRLGDIGRMNNASDMMYQQQQ